MKRFFLNAFLTLAAGVSAFGNVPNAVANIPYEFVANGVTLPAGRYAVEMHLNSVRLVSLERGQTVMVPAPQIRSAKPTTNAQIIMKREGGKMYIVGVRSANSDVVRIVGPGY